jgi:hypothetical protein
MIFEQNKKERVHFLNKLKKFFAWDGGRALPYFPLAYLFFNNCYFLVFVISKTGWWFQ